MNQLQKIDEFKNVLADYRLSDAARKALETTQLVLFVGPSSSGRNTIINELLKSGKYHFIVSDTTRQPRENNGVLEQNGREYWFRTEDEILSDLQAGQFLEAAIIHGQQVSGISIRELQSAATESKIAVNEIEITGGENIHDAKPDAMFLFIVPPSFDEWMARMNIRGTLPEDEVIRRVTSAINEIDTALKADYYQFVVNDTFMQTAKRIDQMITEHVGFEDEQESARNVAAELLEQTRRFISDQATA